MERILGIDPGSRITGYGVIEASRGDIHFVSCGIIRTQSGAPFAHRLNEIFEGINEVIQVHEPVVAAVEDLFVAKNVRSALKLGQARGAAVVAAMQNGLDVHDYSPRTVKQSVAGYGHASDVTQPHISRRRKSRCSIWFDCCCIWMEFQVVMQQMRWHWPSVMPIILNCKLI